MFRSILVPLDGSRFGEQALPLALAVARRGDAEICVVHVHASEDPTHPDWYLPPGQQSDPEAQARQRAYLQGAVGKLRAAGVRASPALLAGLTVPTLCEYAASSRADLVVMTTHGRGPLARAWLGGVADGVVRQMPVPVLLARPKERPADLSAEVPLRHFLIPLDGTPEAEAVLGPALELGEPASASYTLLRVVTPVPVLGYDVFGYAPASTDATLIEQLRRQAADYLNGVAARLRERGLHVRTVVRVDPSVAGAILTEADARVHDLIALQTHGRGGPARLLLGSVADKLVRGAVIPVLVHRGAKP